MDAGPLIFIAIAVAIAMAGILIPRLFRRSINRDLPGSKQRGAGTHWYARPDFDDDGE
jgi:hypothetical protein